MSSLELICCQFKWQNSLSCRDCNWSTWTDANYICKKRWMVVAKL